MEPAKLTKLVRGELDWIVMKRWRRTAPPLRDGQRPGDRPAAYLDDEPVQACPPSAWYRFRKFARRHKAALATAGLVGAMIIVVALVGYIFFFFFFF